MAFPGGMFKVLDPAMTPNPRDPNARRFYDCIVWGEVIGEAQFVPNSNGSGYYKLGVRWRKKTIAKVYCLRTNPFVYEITRLLKKDDVVVLPSGLQYRVVKQGNGRKPGRTDKVRCHYEGTFTNGMKFDSSYDRKEPAVFGVNQVIAGWTEALQLMSEGSEWELFIPYQLAYGEAGAHGSIPPCAALVFKGELLEVL